MIQEKLGLNGALKICKFWNNGALKNTLPRLKDWSLFIEEKS